MYWLLPDDFSRWALINSVSESKQSQDLETHLSLKSDFTGSLVNISMMSSLGKFSGISCDSNDDSEPVWSGEEVDEVSI